MMKFFKKKIFKQKKEKEPEIIDGVVNTKELKKDLEITHKQRTLKILIVDDADINRYVLKKYIEIYQQSRGVDISVSEALNGLDCFEKASNDDFTIIFMDLVMPFMNGIEATKKILEKPGHKPVIIGLTGQIEENTKTQIKESGMKYCIYKPVDMQTIHSFLDLI